MSIEINEKDKLYAILDITTNKLVKNLTNPGHKYWEMKGHCVNTLNFYKAKYENYYKNNKSHKYINPNNLKIVEFKLSINGFLEE